MFASIFGIFADAAWLITLELMAKNDLIELSPEVAIVIFLFI